MRGVEYKLRYSDIVGNIGRRFLRIDVHRICYGYVPLINSFAKGIAWMGLGCCEGILGVVAPPIRISHCHYSHSVSVK